MSDLWHWEGEWVEEGAIPMSHVKKENNGKDRTENNLKQGEEGRWGKGTARKTERRRE